MKKLETVTLVGIDCVELSRLRLAITICKRDFEFAETRILSSISGDGVIKIEPLDTHEAYSKFVLEKLTNYITTNHALIVQYDGFILNPEAWSDEFLNYDYIGAPWLVGDWAIEKFDFPPKLKGQLVVGNGGFSLRSKKLLELTARLLREGKITKSYPEDCAIGVYYRELLENEGIKFAPVELAKQFSYEAYDDVNKSWDGQFGFHGLNWTDISKWTKKHSEYKIKNPANSHGQKGTKI